MSEQPTGERAADLLAHARTAGFEVSERQLVRWHKQGLMPRPDQRWIEEASGSSSIYPTGSSDQLTVLCAISKKFRRSADIGWWLWWLGFPVHEKHWLGRLKSSATLYDTKLSNCFRLATRRDRVSGLKTHRTTNVIFRRLRKRIGPNEFNSVMAYLSEIISGQFEGWGASIASHGKERDKAAVKNLEKVFDLRDKDILRDRKAIGRALGIKIPRNVKDAALISSYPPEIEPALLLLSNRIGGTRLTAVLKDCSFETIISSRNKLRCLLTAAQFFPKNSQNERIDRATTEMINCFSQYDIFLKPADQALFLLLFLTLMEDNRFNCNVDAWCDLFVAETCTKGISEETIDRLRRTDRALADLLSSGLRNVRSQTGPSD
jgi:hypothetical protein